MELAQPLVYLLYDMTRHFILLAVFLSAVAAKLSHIIPLLLFLEKFMDLNGLKVQPSSGNTILYWNNIRAETIG